MKKSKVISFFVFAILALPYVMMFAGCDHDPANPAGATTYQGQIDAAAAGSSVTLNTSYTGSSITISKALSVNGSGIQNLSITVYANVASDVTLTNFANASVTVTNGTSGSIAHSARAASPAGGNGDDDEKPKELGDDNAKLKLEDCTIRRFSTDEDVTLILGKDDRKVEIDELELKDGVEEFVLIGKDEDDDTNDKKSRIEKLTLEAGVDEVDLIGARFEDIEFKGEFDEKIDLYYEKGTEDKQFTEDFKAAVEAATTKIESKDVCAVRNGTGIYKVTINKEKLIEANGAVFIMLLTDEQLEAYMNSIPENPINDMFINPEQGWPWASKAKPYFDICYTGSYLFNTDGTDVHAVAGDMVSFYHYIEDVEDYTEWYENYLNYSKETLCTQSDGTNVTIYVNMANLRKADLNTCAYKADGLTDEYYMTPNKLTEIDLTGYKPYIVLDYYAYNRLHSQNNPEGFNQDLCDVAKAYFGTPHNEKQIAVPISKFNNNIGFKFGFIFDMVSTTAYPDVSDVQYDTIPCPAHN